MREPVRAPETTRTTTVLLLGLRDQANADAWGEFDRRYRPIVLAFVRRLGLQEMDAADVAQETMARFIVEYRAGKYDRNRGRLRSWLIGLAKYRAAAVHRQRARRRECHVEASIVDTADAHTLTVIWEAERQRVMLSEAMKQLRESTRTSERSVQVFELYVTQSMPASAVAAQLHMSEQDVYRIKNRIAERLRELIRSMESDDIE